MTHQFGHSQKIVIVEDNQALSEIYKTRLELLGYTVFAAYDGLQGLAVIEKELPDLVLLDLMVPKVAGDQVLERMRESEWGKDIKVMIISNLNETEAPAGLRNLGIEGYAVKANLSNDQLDKLVEVILKPVGQAEDVLLAHTEKPELAHNEPSGPPPDHTSADPMSGTRFQGDAGQTTPATASAPAVPVAPVADIPPAPVADSSPVVEVQFTSPAPAAPSPPPVQELAQDAPAAAPPAKEVSPEDRAL